MMIYVMTGVSISNYVGVRRYRRMAGGYHGHVALMMTKLTSCVNKARPMQ